MRVFFKAFCLKILTCFFVMVLLSHHTFASGKQEVMIIDASHLEPTELEIKKALIYSLFHYNWQIKQHQRSYLKVAYQAAELDINVDGAKVSIVHPNAKVNVSIGDAKFQDAARSRSNIVGLDPTWLPRLKQLYLRQLAYYIEVRKAESLLK